jgi:hypothetical protein
MHLRHAADVARLTACSMQHSRWLPAALPRIQNRKTELHLTLHRAPAQIIEITIDRKCLHFYTTYQFGIELNPPHDQIAAAWRCHCVTGDPV